MAQNLFALFQNYCLLGVLGGAEGMEGEDHTYKLTFITLND